MSPLETPGAWLQREEEEQDEEEEDEKKEGDDEKEAIQRVGSAMPIGIFLLRDHVHFCVTQRVGQPEFSTLLLWKMHLSLKTCRESEGK